MPRDLNKEHQTEEFSTRINGAKMEDTLPTEMRISHIVYFDSQKENTYQDVEATKFGQGAGSCRSYHSRLMNRHQPSSAAKKQTSNLRIFWIGAILAAIMFVGGIGIGLTLGGKTD